MKKWATLIAALAAFVIVVAGCGGVSTAKKSEKILRPATVEEYSAWLEGYIMAGGKPTHGRGSFNENKTLPILIATRDFRLPALYGSHSVIVLVPRHIKFLGPFYGDEGIGHNRLLFMNGFQTSSHPIVLMFDDAQLSPQAQQKIRPWIHQEEEALQQRLTEEEVLDAIYSASNR